MPGLHLTFDTGAGPLEHAPGRAAAVWPPRAGGFTPSDAHGGRRHACRRPELRRMAHDAGWPVRHIPCRRRLRRFDDLALSETGVGIAPGLGQGDSFLRSANLRLPDTAAAGTNSIAPVAAASAEVQRLPEGNFRLLPEPAGTGSADSGAQPSCQLQLPPLSAAQFALQRQVRGCWRDLYVVRNEPACDADIAQANWYNCTHPDARFVSSFFVSRVGGDERHHIVNGAHCCGRQRDGRPHLRRLTRILLFTRFVHLPTQRRHRAALNPPRDPETGPSAGPQK